MNCNRIIISLFFGWLSCLTVQGQAVMADTTVHIERKAGEDDLQAIIGNDDLNDLPIGTELRFYNGVPVLVDENGNTSPVTNTNINSNRQDSIGLINTTQDRSSLPSDLQNTGSSSTSGSTSVTSNPKATDSGSSTANRSSISSSTDKSSARADSNTPSSRSSGSRSSGSQSTKTRKKRKRNKVPKWNPFNKRKNRKKSGCKY